MWKKAGKRRGVKTEREGKDRQGMTGKEP